jgi:hypothetical protein
LKAAVFLLVSVLAACDTGDAQVDQLERGPAGAASRLGQSYSGCWFLNWSPNDGVPTHGVLVFPDSVYLSSTIAEDGWRSVEPATRAEGRAFDGTSDDPGPLPWEVHFGSNRWSLEGDSAVVHLSDGGYEYWRLRLGLSEGELSGTAEYGSDAGPGDPPLRAEVTGTPFRCLLPF